MSTFLIKTAKEIAQDAVGQARDDGSLEEPMGIGDSANSWKSVGSRVSVVRPSVLSKPENTLRVDPVGQKNSGAAANGLFKPMEPVFC